MNKLKLFLLMSISFFCMAGYAQKKEISAARDNVKAGNNLTQAQASMEKLLKDSMNRGNLKIWNILYDAVRKQYEQGNEKLYLKQAYDTAQLFNLTRQLFEVAQNIDSVEMVPDRKGKVRIEYRKQHADYLGKSDKTSTAVGSGLSEKPNILRHIAYWTSICIAPTFLSSPLTITERMIN